MKKLSLPFAATLALVCAVAFFTAPPAAQAAPIGVPATVSLTTNLVAASQTMTNAVGDGLMPCVAGEYLAVQVKCRNTNAVDAATLVFKFSRSLDGSVFEATPFFTWTAPTLATTNWNCVFTNLHVGAARWLRLDSIQNTSTGTVAGLEVTIAGK